MTIRSRKKKLDVFQRLEQDLLKDGAKVEIARSAVWWYRQFWTVKRAFPREWHLVSAEVDWVWHRHLSDLRRYRDDCRYFFGGFLPHVPSDQHSRRLVSSSNRQWEEGVGAIPTFLIVCQAGPICD
jgi:hypothetical protein